MAHFLENPYFWEPSALAEFMTRPAMQGLTSLQGATLKKTEKGYTLGLQGFKIELQLPSNMQSLRIQTGLFKSKSKAAPDWTGYGAEWIEAGANPQVCGLGVEPVGSKAIFMLNYMRSALKRAKYSDDSDVQKGIPRLWTQTARTAAGDDVQLYGYCAPLRDNPSEIGYYLASLDKARPRTGIFKVLK